MPEREFSRVSPLLGPALAESQSPFWSWYDLWPATILEVKYWDISIPNDGMVYKLCNYNQAMMPTGWIYVLIEHNGTKIYNQYSGFTIMWSPGSASAPMFVYPDVLRVTIPHLYGSYAVNYYWQMDFWREPRG